MKHLRETFTDQEFARLKEAKEQCKMNWHDLLLTAIPEFAGEYCVKPLSPEERLKITKDLIEDSKWEEVKPK